MQVRITSAFKAVEEHHYMYGEDRANTLGGNLVVSGILQVANALVFCDT